MQINNRSLQDMHIFGDPLLVPIIIVERMTNVYRSGSVLSNIISMEDGARHVLGNGFRTTNKFSGSSQQNEHVLRAVVFVHGFQAGFTFLQLLLSSRSVFDFISSSFVISRPLLFLGLSFHRSLKCNREIIWIYGLFETSGF